MDYYRFDVPDSLQKDFYFYDISNIGEFYDIASPSSIKYVMSHGYLSTSGLESYALRYLSNPQFSLEIYHLIFGFINESSKFSDLHESILMNSHSPAELVTEIIEKYSSSISLITLNNCLLVHIRSIINGI